MKPTQKLLLFTIICASLITGCSLIPGHQTTTSIGELAPLLDQNLSDSERSKLIQDNQLDAKYLLIYEVDYLVRVNADSKNPVTLPIVNPTVAKSVRAMSSSIPLASTENSQAAYGIQADPNWVNTQKIGKIEKPLTIKYLFDIRSFNTLPDDLTISQIKSDALVKSSRENNGLALAYKLSNQIRSSLPQEKQDNLAAVVNAYLYWINQNLVYPADAYKEPLRGKYINLNSSEHTLTTGIGVCDDFATVLADFLKCQGIASEYIFGNVPKSLSTNTKLSENLPNHIVIGIPTDKGFYFIDPTTQDNSVTADFKLPDGTTVKASQLQDGLQKDLMVFPLCPTEFPNQLLMPSHMSFEINAVRLTLLP